MIIISVLLWLILSLLLLVLLVLALALDYSIRARLDEELYLKASVSWAGVFRGDYLLGDGLQLRLAGFPIKVGQQRNDKVRKDRFLQEKGTGTGWKLRRVAYPLGVRQTVVLARDLLEYLRPRVLDVYIRAGFEDPYHTGLMASAAYTVLGGLRGVKVEPVFHEETLSGRVLIEGRVRPLALVAIVLRHLGPVLLGKIKRKLMRKREETRSVGV